MTTDTMHESMFAYPTLRKFPMNTAEATQGSIGAYKVQKQSFPAEVQTAIEANLTKAAAYYGIEASFEPEKTVPEAEIMFKGASENVKMTEIASMDALEKAVDFILEKRASVPRENLAEAAKYVLWNAANSGVDMDTEAFRKVAHIAGVGVGDREAIQHELEKRGVLYMMTDSDKKAFYKYAKELEALSDDDFYCEKNLNAVCNTIDGIDFLYNGQWKHAKDLGYPEDVVFAKTASDLVKAGEDFYYVKSADATLSKKATMERKDAINGFLKAHFASYEPLDGEKLIEKVASLDMHTANALLEAIA